MQELCNKNECARAIFGYFAAKRERDPRNGKTKLGSIHRELGRRFDFDALQDTFVTLENCTCGRFQKGRPAKRGRFEWLVSPREIAAQLEGLEAEAPANGAGVIKAANGNDLETFPFPVRPGITLPVTIRRDMGAAELTNLSDFIKVIAASRGIADAAKGENR